MARTPWDGTVPYPPAGSDDWVLTVADSSLAPPDIDWRAPSGGGGDGDFLPLTGGQLTGPLLLASNAPQADTEAVTRRYVLDQFGQMVFKGGDTMLGPLVWNRTIGAPGTTIDAGGALVTNGVDSAAIRPNYVAGRWVRASAETEDGGFIFGGIADQDGGLLKTAGGGLRLRQSKNDWRPVIESSDGTAQWEIIDRRGGELTGELSIHRTTANFGLRFYDDIGNVAWIYSDGNRSLVFRGEAVGQPAATFMRTRAGSPLHLEILAEPVDPLDVATKGYVDSKITGGPAGDYLPLTGGQLSGPLVIATGSTPQIQVIGGGTAEYNLFSQQGGQIALRYEGGNTAGTFRVRYTTGGVPQTTDWMVIDNAAGGGVATVTFPPNAMIVAARAPTADSHLANKAYVDANAGGGATATAWENLASYTSPTIGGTVQTRVVTIAGESRLEMRGYAISNNAYSQGQTINIGSVTPAHRPAAHRLAACVYASDAEQMMAPAQAVTIFNVGSIAVMGHQVPIAQSRVYFDGVTVSM